MKIESSTPLKQFQPNFSIIKKSSIKSYFYVFYDNNSNEIKTKRKTSKNTSSSTIKTIQGLQTIVFEFLQ